MWPFTKKTKIKEETKKETNESNLIDVGKAIFSIYMMPDKNGEQKILVCNMYGERKTISPHSSWIQTAQGMAHTWLMNNSKLLTTDLETYIPMHQIEKIIVKYESHFIESKI